MNWYIGQRIVAIETYHQGGFKKGDEFTIKGLRGSTCRCPEVEIDIGMRSYGAELYQCVCRRCGNTTIEEDPTHWFSSRRFAPLDEWHEAEKAVKELLKPQKVEL